MDCWFPGLPLALPGNRRGGEGGAIAIGLALPQLFKRWIVLSPSSGKRNWFPKYLSAGWIALFSFITTGARLHCPLEKEWEYWPKTTTTTIYILLRAIVITHSSHSSHVCSQLSFGLPLRINGMHRTQFGHPCRDHLYGWSLIYLCAHCSSVPTVPLCPPFLCAYRSSVPTVPLFLSAYCPCSSVIPLYSSVPTVPLSPQLGI